MYLIFNIVRNIAYISKKYFFRLIEKLMYLIFNIVQIHYFFNESKQYIFSYI
jgi:hypothetical protein